MQPGPDHYRAGVQKIFLKLYQLTNNLKYNGKTKKYRLDRISFINSDVSIYLTMATSQQLRALRRKHHLGEFSRKRKVYKHKSSHNSMARKKRYSSRRSGGSMKGVWGQMLGVGIYVLYEQYIESMIPLQEPMLSVAELGVSYWISKKSGIVGDIGKAGVYINVYQLMKYFSSTMLPGIGQTSQRSNVTSMFAY